MEVFKFRRGEPTGADVVLPAFGGAEETDDEDSFFDLVLKSPDSVAVSRRGVAAEKDFQFMESPRDVFVRRNDFLNSKPLYKVTLVRSTPKFRVFMLGFRKSSECEKSESNGEPKWSPSSKKSPESNRLSVTCSCRVEKTSVAGDDNSLRSQIMRETFEYENSPQKSTRSSLHKYLKLIRPLYLMVWKRRHEKTKFTDNSSSPAVVPAAADFSSSRRRISDGSRIGSFKIAARRLGKSRSVSTAVGMAPQQVSRRDDSLLERRDGIQNAVMYCKKSYNSSSQEISKLFQSSADPLHLGRSSCEEPKRFSI